MLSVEEQIKVRTGSLGGLPESLSVKGMILLRVVAETASLGASLEALAVAVEGILSLTMVSAYVILIPNYHQKMVWYGSASTKNVC